MKNIKRIIIFYLIGIIFLIAVFLIFGRQLIPILIDKGVWIVPIIFSALGFLVGAWIYAMLGSPIEKRDKIFFITHFIALISMLILAIVFQNDERNYKNNYANKDANHNVLKYFLNSDEGYIKIAFYKLELEFKNPNDFKLVSFSTYKQDTLMGSFQDTVYNIYFTYYLKNDKGNKYFSKVSVLSGVPTIHLYNLDTKTNEEYLTIKGEKDKREQDFFKSIKESFEQMEDSTKKAIFDSKKKYINE